MTLGGVIKRVTHVKNFNLKLVWWGLLTNQKQQQNFFDL